MSTKTLYQNPTMAEISLSTQEKLAENPSKQQKLYIGVPKESSFQESRVPLTPESVLVLTNNGHRVVVESEAGLEANFSDHQYSEAGAEITSDTQRVFRADTIVKIAPPTLAELDMMKSHQTIFSPLHLPTLSIEYFQKLISKKITALAYEYIKDEDGNFPMVRAVSEIAGSVSILIAAEYLSNTREGQGVLLGGVAGVPPTKVVILGGGVVGEFATRTALGLGAEVRVFDNNVYKLMRLRNNVNVMVYTSVLNPETLQKELCEADVVIGAIHSESGRTPCVVSEEMVSRMKAGSVIIDISIDQGGCFATSKVTNHTHPTFKKYDVIHYCVPNIASRVAKTASSAVSHVLTPILLRAHKFGGLDKFLMQSTGTRNGVYIYKGCLTNQHISHRFNLKYTDIDLLMTASS
ncbi:MAG: alanine dehydrogenase [Chitinophagales bacterium]